MSYPICTGCNHLIKMGTVYQVGDGMYHETCRPSFQRENWKFLTEGSPRVWEAGGLVNWRKLDWNVLELPVDQRRGLKASGYTMDQIKEKLKDFGKPLCIECEKYVWPWENFTQTKDGSYYHHDCIINKMVEAVS